MALWIPMKVVPFDPDHPIAGEYAYRNGKGWVKWGHSDDVYRRREQHQISMGELPHIICVIERMTRIDDVYLLKTLHPWHVPLATREWFYDVEAMWQEARRVAGMLQLGFIRLEDRRLPLFDGVHPYLA